MANEKREHGRGESKSPLLQRAEREWSGIAKEPVEVENVGGVLYAYGSELACLRLFKAFAPGGHCAYSANLASWYFTTGKPVGVPC